MAKRITDQSQDEIEAMVVGEEQAGELSEGAEMSDMDTQNAGRTTEAQDASKKEVANLAAQNNNHGEANEGGAKSRSPRQTTSRTRKKSTPSASATTAEGAAPEPVTAGEEAASAPKPAATRKRKTSAKPAQSALDAAEAPAPRKRRTPAQAAPPAQEAADAPIIAGEEIAIVPENTPAREEPVALNEGTAEISAEQQAAETPETASSPEIAQEAAPGEPEPHVEEPASSPETVPLVEEQVVHSTSSRNEEIEAAPELPTSEEAPVSDEEQTELAATVEMVPLIEEAALAPSGIAERVPAVAVETAEAPVAAERGHLVRSAALVSIGNLGSSLLGMVRQIVVTSLGSSFAGPFNAAIAPVNTFYQLLVNGSTDGALIPVFNEYAADKRHDEMRRVVFTVVNLVGIIALIASIGYLLISPWFVNSLVSGYLGADKALTLQFSQIIFFSLVVLGPFAVLLAALFSLKEFGWPAFATAAYHAGIIMGAVVASLIGLKTWGIIALPIGLLIGSAGQIALLLPGMRKHKLSYMFVLDLKHPALKRIYHLYWPIAISYVFSTVLVLLDLHLQSWTPQKDAATTAMAAATVLIQFPTGLVAQALSVAVLPTLSEHARAGNNERFKETLLLGIRLGLLLMIPAMTGLLVLRTPIIYAIFAHHNYTLADADLGALALQNYAYQLPFLAIDQLMIAAFYARRNTKIPVFVYIASILFYLVVALPFYSTIGVAALAFANTLQNSMHAVILLILLRMAIGSLHLRRAVASVLKICVAAAIMAVVAWGAMTLLGHVGLFSLQHLPGQILTVIVAGGLASMVYFGALWLFKVEEIKLVKGTILAKLGKK